NAALLAFDQLVVDEHRVARLKVRNLLAGGKLRDLLLLELLDQIHGNLRRQRQGLKRAQALFSSVLSGSGELLRQSSAFVTCSDQLPEAGQKSRLFARLIGLPEVRSTVACQLLGRRL